METVTELKDPVGKVSYVWSVKSGTSSTGSPFVKNKGGDAMEIWMMQTSSYTDEYGNQATGEPKAKIKLSVEKDTVWAKTLDELKAFADKAEGVPSGQAATQKFGSDLQNVDVEWSYETGEAEMAGKTIPMPFYALSPVTLKDFSVKELSEENINGKFFSFYEVTATFSQKAVAENVTTQTDEMEIEYVVRYVGAIEISLVKVEYYPGGEWVDPHHNMVLSYYWKVERYRTYSNGKRFGPDEFYPYGSFVEIRIGGGINSEDVISGIIGISSIHGRRPTSETASSPTQNLANSPNLGPYVVKKLLVTAMMVLSWGIGRHILWIPRLIKPHLSVKGLIIRTIRQIHVRVGGIGQTSIITIPIVHGGYPQTILSEM